ncbi:ion channel protein Tsx [Parashewanella curva]|uniref:Ion channel protein Tsx n=2 Tax=Parashewanella curva TaxID=2338552 RepID=A0A3L8Q2R1_9GAMM|nr:ion channel protein Tsx [Parashewanella curva]
MKNFKMLAIAGAAAAAMTAGTAQAEQYYGFMTASVNYLDWTEKTIDRTTTVDQGGQGLGGTKKDFLFLELEGGAGYDWGDVYGFIDIENPGNINKSQNERKEGDKVVEERGVAVPSSFRIAAKGSIAYNIGKTNWNAYGHIYSFTEARGDFHGGFFDQNVVLGVSYDINTDSGFWMKPFIGLHYENQRFAGAGFNGYMAGWVLGYNFKLGNQNFMVSNWHETEFAREDQFRSNGTPHKLDKMGQNGAVALWWNATKKFTAGVQYRYADQKLGTAAYHDAVIFTAKYNF